MSTKFIYDIENSTVLAVAEITSEGSVFATDGAKYGVQDLHTTWMFVPNDLDAVHIEINGGDKMSLAALVTANSQEGCNPLDYDMVLGICALPIGDELRQFHDEDIRRVAAPVTSFFVARVRDGHAHYDFSGTRWADKDDAIVDLFNRWSNWMDMEFIHNIPGEVLEDGDDVSPAVVSGGELGWYKSGNNSVGEGRADFADADYPMSAPEWVRRDIDSFCDDVYTWSVHTVTDYED